MLAEQKVRHLDATELIATVLDEGSYRSWDQPVRDPDPSPAYQAELAAARGKSGVDESVLTGEGLIRGRRVAVIVSEFRFLAGSIGAAAAERIVSAVERATAEGLPLLAGPHIEGADFTGRRPGLRHPAAPRDADVAGQPVCGFGHQRSGARFPQLAAEPVRRHLR